MRYPKPFPAPAGVIGVRLDKITNRLATPTCPDDYFATFIAGTEPRDFCDQSGQGGISGFFSKIFGQDSKPSPPPAVSNGTQVPSPTGAGAENAPAAQDQSKRKKGFWGRLFGGGTDDKDKKGDKTNPPTAQPAGSQADPTRQPRN